MHPIPPLAALGRRIMILGTTNAGKSTLGDAIARKLAIPAIHADLLHHRPYTDWEPRPRAEFEALHDEAIARPEWVIDGNYSIVLPARFARASGVIVLDDTLRNRMGRYFRRTLIQKRRIGGLPGDRDSIKWSMIHWLWHTRNSAAKYRQMTVESGLPRVFVSSETELNALYSAWQLQRVD